MASLVLAPIEDAVRFHDAKTPVGSKLRTAEWEEVALGLRNASQFSAGVEEVRVMALAQRDIGRILSHYRPEGGVMTDRSGFIRDLTGLADSLGLAPKDESKRGGIEDITSEARAELIYQQQVGSAYGFADWKAGQDADALDAAPAQELVRIRDAKVPRDWDARWAAAGSAVDWVGAVQSPKAALKTSPIWEKLSRFGNPWPPFDFNSGMWVEDLSRDEAERLGLIVAGQQIQPSEARFDAKLEASVAGLKEDERGWLRDMFGDQVQFQGTRAVWQGQLIKGYVRHVLENPQAKLAALKLGGAAARAIELAAEYDVDLRNSQLLLEAGQIRKTWRDHGPGGEKRPGQAALTPLDYELIPHLWREPDTARRGESGTVTFEKTLLGRLVGAIWRVPSGGNPRFTMQTLYKKQAP